MLQLKTALLSCLFWVHPPDASSTDWVRLDDQAAAQAARGDCRTLHPTDEGCEMRHGLNQADADIA